NPAKNQTPDSHIPTAPTATGNIFKLQDDSAKVTFLNCLTGASQEQASTHTDALTRLETFARHDTYIRVPVASRRLSHVLSPVWERVRGESQLLLPLRRCDVHAAFATQEADAFENEQEDRRRLRRGRRIPGCGPDAGARGLGHAGLVCRVGVGRLFDRLDHHAR